MTDLTMPGESKAEIANTPAGNSWEKSSVGGWIVDGFDLASIYSAVDETVLNGFAHASTSGLDVTIDPGEAYVGGWLCRDTSTTVTLPAGEPTIIYVGYDSSAVLSDGQAPADSENIIIGPGQDFANEDPMVPLYEFMTDDTTVTSVTDYRILQKPLEIDHTNGRVVSRLDHQVDGNLTLGGSLTITEGSYMNGSAVLYKSSDWDGETMTFETSDGDTIELRRE